MKRTAFLCSVLVVSTFAIHAEAAESEVASRISRIGLFKNGLAVVNREIDLPGPGTWVLRNPPAPVHGTFWIESEGRVRATLSMRPFSKPVEVGPDNLSDALAGCEVEFSFGSERIPPLRGTVVSLPREEKQSGGSAEDRRFPWGRDYGPPHPQSRFVAVKTATGTFYFAPHTVTGFTIIKGEPSVASTAPVLLLEATDLVRPAKVRLTYLTAGISWAPAYRVDLAKPAELNLLQSAVIRNELEDFDGAMVELISGFPSVEYGHVSSPLAPASSWASFFSALNSSQRDYHAMASNLTQQVMYNDPVPARSAVDFSSAPAGEGVDLHFQPLGALSLKRGDSIFLNVIKGEAGYERIVEWLIPDTRDEYGRATSRNDRSGAGRYDGVPWDSILFRNPFHFPMTTAPAAIYEKGQFRGQQSSFWVNPGQETSIRINKALSLRALNSEHEIEGSREAVYIGRNDYYKTAVQGAVKVTNHRGVKVRMIVRRRFSGDLLEAEGSARTSLLEEGVYSLNPRREIVWDFVLEAGKEIELGYKYSVLVDR